MTVLGGEKTWFTAADLAALALPGLPKVKRAVNELAADARWALRRDSAGKSLARPRAGRGGGLEYHAGLLPPAATAELARRGLIAFDPASNVVPIKAPEPPDCRWAWFERQSDLVKEQARRRQRACDAVAAIERGGQSRTCAVAQVAVAHVVSPATVWTWLGLVAGVPRPEWLPSLAPRRQGGGAEREIDAQAWSVFKSDYLRPERPTLASCYARLKAYAAPRALEFPHLKTLQRRLEREVDGRVIVARRSGAEALRRLLPPQQRTVAGLAAMELVNIDGHKWDVFVRWPDGHVQRPMMVAIQDVYSRKFLAWRIGESENVAQTRLAFGDLFKAYGIPAGCVLDNGRAFASKAMTGGAKTRFRWKIRPEDPTGLLTSLGIDIHWAIPFRGQSKPIERGFRDLCDHGARHPAFAGAYTGNSPTAKPENYGERAVDLAVFTRIVGQIMAAHNAKGGRRTEAAHGGSFDEAFAASYARAPIRKAAPEQLRMALLAADQVTADRASGAIRLYDNRYWSEALSAVAGDKVTVRFDPDDLSGEVHVYTLDGRFLATAPAREATGFLDVAAAKARARLESDHRKAARRAVELEGLLTADQVAALLPGDEPEGEVAGPRVIRPVRIAATAAAARRAPIIDRFDFEEIAPARLRLVE
ncbi:MAG: transposase domain-containing protein [Caulobacteraceae bacterium]